MPNEPITLDFSKAQPIPVGVALDFSKAQPLSTQTAPPAGFFARFAQSLGLPNSQADAEKLGPQSIADSLQPSALYSAVKAGSGLLTPIVSYAKTAAQGIKEGAQEVLDAGRNVAEGGPIDLNRGKAIGGLVHGALQATPVVGPTLDQMGGDISQQNFAGAAGDAAGFATQVLAPKVIGAVSDLPAKAIDAAKDTFGTPTPEPLQPQLPKPVSTPLPVDSPFDDATIRASVGGKDLSPDARETLRNAAGPVIPAGSSPKLQLLRAVPEINSTITTQSNALAKILSENGPLSTTPEANVSAAIEKLTDSFAGGTEDTFGKAVAKEVGKAKDVLNSTDPVEINKYIRTLDKSINSYTSPEEGIDTPSNAADAARVTIRRALRDTLNTEIPETQPLNSSLADNIEVRSVLRKQLGNVADDSSAANSQYVSELAKGQSQLARDTANEAIQSENAARTQKAQRYRNAAGTVAKTVVLGGGAGAGVKLVSDFVK